MFKSIVLAVLFSITSVSLGQSISVKSLFRSQYVFGNGNLVSEKPVIQSDIFASTKDGFWADAWWSLPASLENIGDNYATEFYLTVGRSGKVSDFNLTLGAGLDDLNPVATLDATDFLIIISEISKDVPISESFTISPFIRTETNFTFDGTVTGVILPRVGSYSSLKIGERVSLDGKAYIIYDPGILSDQIGLVGNVEEALHFKIGDIMAEIPFIRFIGPIGESDGRKKENWIIGCGSSLNL